MEKNNSNDEEKEEDIEKIIKILKEKNVQKNILDIISKILYDNSFLIHLIYTKQTELNPFLEDISFSILLMKDKIPYIKCLTNFTFPTLYDNRNLFNNIINNSYNVNVNKVLDISQKIIYNIPIFLKQIYEDISIRVLVYYGIYNLQNEYNINDFIENNSLKFFRVKIINNKSSKKNYLIITDIYILLFEPKEKEESKGILINKIDINYDLIKFDKTNYYKKYNQNSIILEFKSFEIEIILLNNISNESFIKIIETKKKFLSERFEVFVRYPAFTQNIQSFDINGKQERIKRINSDNMKNILSIINYKEKLYEYRKRNNKINKDSINNLIKELIIYYERIIEILSAKGKEFTSYLSKMKKLMIEEY